jgi:hypothetical protein
MSIVLHAGFTFQAMPKQTVMTCGRCTDFSGIERMHIRLSVGCIECIAWEPCGALCHHRLLKDIKIYRTMY